MHVQEMFRARSYPPTAHLDGLARCISDCLECAKACTACADACLADPRPEALRRCIGMAQDCADICTCVGRILARQTEAAFALRGRCIELAAEASGQCADECAHHAARCAFCRVCQDVCRTCERSCRDVLARDYTMPCSMP